MKPANFSQKIQEAARIISASTYTVVLTGAGISTPSGIPDFRSAGSGLWNQNNPMQVASLTAFRYRPQVFYNWLRPLAGKIWEAQPNPAHKALAQLEAEGFVKAVVTQNIDDLHQRAGSKEVIQVHGSVSTLTCSQCHQQDLSENHVVEFIEKGNFPKCAHCDGILKPDIVLFEEALPMDAWAAAEDHFERADLVLVVGSSLEVSPANSLPLYALENGARLVINTMSGTYLDARADLLLPFDVSLALPAIVEEIHRASGQAG